MKNAFDACGGSIRGRGRGAPISFVLTLKNIAAPRLAGPDIYSDRGTVLSELNVNASTKAAARHLGDFVEIR